MLRNEEKCERVRKNTLLYRASLRGLKKCTSCGFINGQRALICRNLNCDLRMKRLAAIKPFDPIQLISYGSTKLYSLRTKEKLLQPRNFVKIAEFLGSVESQPEIVCYVDNCKYDVFEPTHLVCRHIKACKVLKNVPQAEIYPIDKSILWNLNITAEQKQRLWNLYQLEEKLIPPVQKLNSSVFAVKCVESKIFPAGRLHITVFSNKQPNKSGNFFCSCKKLKIILEPDNSVSMKPEICDHLLLLLAAILNKPEGKVLYTKFLDSLQFLWMPTTLNTPIGDCDIRPSDFIDYDLSLDQCAHANVKLANVEGSDNSDLIFNFTEELFTANNIPDFSDIVLDVNKEKSSNVQMLSSSRQFEKPESNVKDPKLNATTNMSDEDMEFNFLELNLPEPLNAPLVAATQTPIDFNESDLSVIEQFQISHNIQISNDNIELAKDIESLNNLESEIMEKNPTSISGSPKQKSLLKIASPRNNKDGLVTKSCNSLTINSTSGPEVLEDQQTTVVKQVPLKIIKIASPIRNMGLKQSSQILQISKINPKNIILVKKKQSVGPAKKSSYNSTTAIQPLDQLAICTKNKELNFVQTMPSINYESWLDHVIEVLNESIIIPTDSPSIKNTFHVPVLIFNNFSTTFTLNNKRKLPINITVVKSGKYKDHIKYTWCFSQISTVERIFTSKNMKIEVERLYQRSSDGSYELYTPTTVKLADNTNFRPIYPKIHFFKAFIQFNSNNELSATNLEPHKCGIKLDWLPSAFPKSKFGLMTTEFCVSFKEFVGIA